MNRRNFIKRTCLAIAGVAVGVPATAVPQWTQMVVIGKNGKYATCINSAKPKTIEADNLIIDMHWDRVLSAAEIQMLYRNPYCMFGEPAK